MKLRVGDIELDSLAGPRLGVDAAGSREADGNLQLRDSPLALARRLPSTAPHWLLAGGVLGVLGATAAALVAGPPVTWLAAFGLIPSISAIGVSAWLGHLRAQDVARTHERDRLLANERRGRLLAVMSAPHSSRSFEELQKALGWDSGVLASALAELVEEGAVLEDMDPQSREWVYEMGSTRLLGSYDSERPLTAAERASLHS